jgi:hypothetical protein
MAQVSPLLIAQQLDEAIEEELDIEDAYADAWGAMHEALEQIKVLCDQAGLRSWFKQADNLQQAEALLWLMQERGDNY